MAPPFNNGDFATGVAAAGTTQETAALLPADHCMIETATDGQGVVLREASRGEQKSVVNCTTATILVYPWVGAAFNGQTTNAGINLGPGHWAQFRCVGTSKIMAYYG